jgi:hypothetical protein
VNTGERAAQVPQHMRPTLSAPRLAVCLELHTSPNVTPDNRRRLELWLQMSESKQTEHGVLSFYGWLRMNYPMLIPTLRVSLPSNLAFLVPELARWTFSRFASQSNPSAFVPRFSLDDERYRQRVPQSSRSSCHGDRVGSRSCSRLGRRNDAGSSRASRHEDQSPAHKN